MQYFIRWIFKFTDASRTGRECPARFLKTEYRRVLAAQFKTLVAVARCRDCPPGWLDDRRGLEMFMRETVWAVSTRPATTLSNPSAERLQLTNRKRRIFDAVVRNSGTCR
jgi:hypothetical protein